MKRLEHLLQQAGLNRLTPPQFLVFCLASAILATLWVQLSFRVWGLSVFVGLAVVAVMAEALRTRAQQRRDAIAKLWPEVIDSLYSASASGIGLVEALSEVAAGGPKPVRTIFEGLVQRLDSGWEFKNAVSWAKSQFGSAHADRLLELALITHELGGKGYPISLKQQAKQARADLAVWGEVESKQGWVRGTAKLALVAPWLIVATLSRTGENAAIYNSAEGTSLLLAGLLVSLIAYRMISLLGQLPSPSRILLR